MPKIPFSEPNLSELEYHYVDRAISSGWIGGHGDFIDKFEEKFAKYIGVKHAVTCSSGTVALMLAYHATGLSGDKYIYAPDNTFIATHNMARLFTNNLVKDEVDKDTWTLKLDGYKDCYVVGVSLYGNPCDMGCVYKNKFIFIEDCAQSLGSKFKGKMTGSYGLASCFSFHSAKTMTTGEGGMVVTNNDEIAKRVRHLKNHAMTTPYHHTGIGYNGRMTNIQAALGLSQLERIEELTHRKREITKYYDEHLDKKYIRQREQRNSHLVKWANAYKHPNAPHIRRELADTIETRPGFLGDDTIVFPCSTKLTNDNLAYIVGIANSHA